MWLHNPINCRHPGYFEATLCVFHVKYVGHGAKPLSTHFNTPTVLRIFYFCAIVVCKPQNCKKLRCPDPSMRFGGEQICTNNDRFWQALPSPMTCLKLWVKLKLNSNNYETQMSSIPAGQSSMWGMSGQYLPNLLILESNLQSSQKFTFERQIPIVSMSYHIESVTAGWGIDGTVVKYSRPQGTEAVLVCLSLSMRLLKLV